MPLPCIGSVTHSGVASDALDGLEQRRQCVADLACSHARDEGQATGLALGVELVDELLHGLGRRRRPELDADRVADPREVVDVRAVEVARALADPEEVRRSCCTGVPVRESMRVMGRS